MSDTDLSTLEGIHHEVTQLEKAKGHLSMEQLRLLYVASQMEAIKKFESGLREWADKTKLTEICNLGEHLLIHERILTRVKKMSIKRGDGVKVDPILLMAEVGWSKLRLISQKCEGEVPDSLFADWISTAFVQSRSQLRRHIDEREDEVDPPLPFLYQVRTTGDKSYDLHLEDVSDKKLALLERFLAANGIMK